MDDCVLVLSSIVIGESVRSILAKYFLTLKYINYGIVKVSVIKNIGIVNGKDIINKAFDF